MLSSNEDFLLVTDDEADDSQFSFLADEESESEAESEPDSRTTNSSSPRPQQIATKLDSDLLFGDAEKRIGASLKPIPNAAARSPAPPSSLSTKDCFFLARLQGFTELESIKAVIITQLKKALQLATNDYVKHINASTKPNYKTKGKPRALDFKDKFITLKSHGGLLRSLKEGVLFSTEGGNTKTSYRPMVMIRLNQLFGLGFEDIVGKLPKFQKEPRELFLNQFFQALTTEISKQLSSINVADNDQHQPPAGAPPSPFPS